MNCVISALYWAGLLSRLFAEALPVNKRNGGDPTEAFRQRFPEKIGLDIISNEVHDDDDDVCSLERTLLPKTLIEGKFISQTMSVELLNALMRDFAQIVSMNKISVRSDNELDQDDHFNSMSHRSCSLGVLGLNWIDSTDLPEPRVTPMTVTVFRRKKGNMFEFFCLCRNPLLGLSHEECQAMLNNISQRTYGVDFPQNISSATSYPAYIYKGKQGMGVYQEGEVITCADGQLKLAAHSLYRQYQVLIRKVSRVADMYNISIPALSCGHDLAAATPQQIAVFANCIEEATSKSKVNRRSVNDVLFNHVDLGNLVTLARTGLINATHSASRMRGQRLRRDLLSALGIREDYSEYISNANRIITENFDLIRDHEDKMLDILKKESAHMKKYMLQENKNIDALVAQFGYLRTQLNHQSHLLHHRELILSSFKSLTLTLSELSEETQNLLEMVLSPLQKQNPVCVNQGCLDKNSLLIDKRSGGLVVSIRETQIESVELLRMSCRLIEKDGKLLRHGLSDKTLWPSEGKLIERESLVVVSDDCIKKGEGCPQGHEEMPADELIQRILYVSSHHGRLEAQCLKKINITTVSGQVECSHKPVVVTLPMALGEKRLDTSILHLWLTLNKKSEPLSDFESDYIETNHIDGYDWSLENARLEFTKPFDIANPFHLWALLLGILLATITILCCSLCYCPQCTRGLMQVLLNGCCTAWATLSLCAQDCRDSCEGQDANTTQLSTVSSSRTDPRVPSTQPGNRSRSRDMFSSDGTGADGSSEEASDSSVDPAHARSEALLRGTLPKSKKKKKKAPPRPVLSSPSDMEFERDLPPPMSPAADTLRDFLKIDSEKENMTPECVNIHRHTVWDGANWFPSMKKGCGMHCTEETCETVASHNSVILKARERQGLSESQTKERLGDMRKEEKRRREEAKAESSARESAESKAKSVPSKPVHLIFPLSNRSQVQSSSSSPEFSFEAELGQGGPSSAGKQ